MLTINRMLAVLFITMFTSACSGVSDVDKLPNSVVFRDQNVAALVDAAEAGEVEAIARLIQTGVDPNSLGRSNVTPLFRVFQARNWEGFQALLKHGANPNLIADGGRAVMFQTAREPDPKWLRAALEHGGDPNLVDHGTPNGRGYTPLFYCFDVAMRPENIKLLAAAGANLNHQESRDGNYPLYLLTGQDAGYELASVLVEAGADFRLKTNSGRDARDNLSGRTCDDFTRNQLENLISVLNQRGAGVPAPKYIPGGFRLPDNELFYRIVERERIEKLQLRQASK